MKVGKINIIIILLSILMYNNCNSEPPVTLIDYYRVYPEDEFGRGYYLICKLGCSSDVKIENITFIAWNDSVIIVRTGTSNYVWYIIKARKDKLKCCNRDILIGPLTNKSVSKYLRGKSLKNVKKIYFD
jgi:hypothetical protein